MPEFKGHRAPRVRLYDKVAIYADTDHIAIRAFDQFNGQGATAHVDIETARKIAEALLTLVRERTGK